MFNSIGQLCVNYRKLIVGLFIFMLILFAILGAIAIPKLQGGGYSNPKGDAAKANAFLVKNFGVKDAAVVIEVKSKSLLTNAQASKDAMALEKELASQPGVEKTLSYWSSGGAPTLISKNSHAAFIFVYSKKLPL